MELELTAVSHRFGRRVLFRDVNLIVEGGTSLAVTGANGSGKSTLLQIAAGLITPWRGSARLTVQNATVAEEDLPLRSALVAPYFNVYDGLTVRENLDFIRKARGEARDDHRIEQIVEEVGLGRRIDDFVSTFSSGMKQRVKLAVALMARPDVLLLDEPSSNLDEAGREVIRNAMRDHMDGGGIVLLATNEAQEAGLCDVEFRVDEQMVAK